MSDPEKVSRLLYGGNPFPESVEIGRYIRENSDPDDTIAVLGSEPQIYFYAQRRGATGYIYAYALMERADFALAMQEEMIAQIEKARPEYIVYVDVQSSWLLTPESPTRIFEWSFDYCMRHYDQVGVITIRDQERTLYDWGRKKVPERPESDLWIGVFRRKAGSS